MSSLSNAKHRALRRRHEAGAVMFIVSMMITVLAAVGMFALAASATEVRTAGNERQNAQTHYLAQYGVIAVANQTEVGRIMSDVSLIKSSPDTCLSLPVPGTAYISGGRESWFTKGCHRFVNQEIATMVGWGVPQAETYAGTTPYAVGVPKPGSLGPIPINGQFFVEMVVSGTRNAPGFSVGTFGFTVVTATAFGVTQPLVGGAVAYGAEGMEMQRARLVAGPMPPP